MDKRSENKLIMIKTVISLLNQNEPTLQESAPLVAALNDLKALIVQIEQTQQTAISAGSGLVTEKQNQQEILIEETFELASMLYALAQRSGDQILKSKVDFPISNLRKLRDGDLSVSCKNVLSLGFAYETALTEYSVTSDKMKNIQALIAQYELHLPAHRVTVSERKAANEKMTGLLAGALYVVTEQLDRLMLRYKSTLPDFYAAYLNARKIVEYGTRHEKPQTPPAQPTA